MKISLKNFPSPDRHIAWLGDFRRMIKLKHNIDDCQLCKALLQDLVSTLLALNQHCDDIEAKKGKYFDDEGHEYIKDT